MIMKDHEIVLKLKLSVGTLGIVLHFNRKLIAAKPDRKPFANSFLPAWQTKVLHIHFTP